jgi:UDP-N-acetylmuramoyl-L-alanyl-D-glutamate--2,6-diaminopimelate ligase
MAARLYKRQPREIAAVTGTNGKTSVAVFVRQIWERLGRKAASLGTLGLMPPRADAPAALTTPDPVELHRCLDALAGDGVEALAMEASSHGLDQYRLDGVRLSAAAFTNLSRDHLDYHDGMEGYLAAKARLFGALLPAGGTAVLNADVPEFVALESLCRERGQVILTYGYAGRDLRLLALHPEPAGLTLELEILGTRHTVGLTLAGAFQAHNLLAAVGLVLAGGADAEAVIATLPHLEGVPGRVEPVGATPAGGQVYVDYAHTPDALATVLQAMRPHVRGRLWVVFGAGGDRDPGKRPLMGEAAARHADAVVVTDDNPRSEDPAAIRAQIMPACPDATEVGERRAAIDFALARLEAGDVLVIAGKGHESGQIVGDTVLPFDDREVARAAIARLAGEAE